MSAALATDINGIVTGKYRMVMSYPSSGCFRGVTFIDGKSTTPVTGLDVRKFMATGCRAEPWGDEADGAKPAIAIATHEGVDRVLDRGTEANAAAHRFLDAPVHPVGFIDIAAPIAPAPTTPATLAAPSVLPDDVDSLRAIFESETGGAANKKWGAPKLKQFILEERELRAAEQDSAA